MTNGSLIIFYVVDEGKRCMHSNFCFFTVFTKKIHDEQLFYTPFKKNKALMAKWRFIYEEEKFGRWLKQIEEQTSIYAENTITHNDK